MKNKLLIGSGIQFAGLILVLGIAYGFDVLIEFLKARNAASFDLNYIILGTYGLTALIVAGAAILLFWYLTVQSRRYAWTSIVYIVIGLLILFFPILYHTPIFSWARYAYPQPFVPGALFYFTGGLTTAMGLLVIVLPKRRIEEA